MTYLIRIMSIDPGGVTGWRRLDIRGDKETIKQNGHMATEYGELDHPEHHLELDELLSTKLRPMRMPHRLILICERFDNRANPAAQLISCEYIGVCRTWIQRHPNVTFITPGPPEKEWADDKKLKAFGFHVPGHKDINDAGRHLAKYVCFSLAFQPMIEQLRGISNV